MNSLGSLAGFAIPKGFDARMNYAVSLSWHIFMRKFLDGYYAISNEASFQLHFASVIQDISTVLCSSEDEWVQVSLESKEISDANTDILLKAKGGSRILGIPIELKFKTMSQGAEDEGAMAIFEDIFRIEKIVYEHPISPIGYFFIITNNSRYFNKPIKTGGLRSVFDTSEGSKIASGIPYDFLQNKTGTKFFKNFQKKYGATLKFQGNYTFSWFHQNENYFLAIPIQRTG